MAILECYIDESGIHGGAERCVVAGLIGGHRQWVRFERLWRQLLDDFDLDELHSKRFFKARQVPPFEDWSTEDGHEFVRRMFGLLRAHKLHAICSNIGVQDFMSFSKDERRLLTGGRVQLNPAEDRSKFFASGAPTKPYHLGFLDVINGAGKFASDTGRTDLKVNFLFDQQEQYEKWADFNFDRAEKVSHHRRYLGALTFGNAEDYPALQAADLTAHLLYCHACGFMSKGIERFGAAIGHRRAYYKEWGRSEMRDLLEVVIEPEYRHLIEWSG